MKPLLSIIFITLTIIISAINSQDAECIDFLNPLDVSDRKHVPCPYVKTKPSTLKFQTGDNMFDIRFACGAQDQVLCDKARKGFEAVGKVISASIILKSKIVMSAKIAPFDDPRILGAAGPSRVMPLSDPTDNIKRLYPQALVKQFSLTNAPQFGDIDIDAQFNSGANFWFDGDPPITASQPNFHTVVLHEMFHGMGFFSGYRDWMNVLANNSPVLDPVVTPMPTFLNENPIVFGEFVETIFDKQVRILTENNKTLTNLTAEFNTYITPKTTFTDPNDFITKFKASQAYTSGKTFLQTAQTPKSLLFVPTAAKANVPEGGFLETTISYQRGSSISHLDQKTYTNTPDFLMRHSLEPGVTTDKLIQLGGNYSGGAIGPLLLDIMSSIGYATVDNPKAPDSPKPPSTDPNTPNNPTTLPLYELPRTITLQTQPTST
nr:11661_t:CDS:2 [Entrophospora candida]